MKLAVMLALAVGVVLSGAAIAAQSKPDFSGVWRPVKVEAGGQSQNVATTQSDIKIKVEATTLTIFHPPDGSHSSIYKLDGSESKNGDETARASWVGNTIVIDATVGDLKIKTKQVFSFDATGSLVLGSTAAPPLGDGSLTRTIFKKVTTQGRAGHSHRLR